jgi:hypothetical protein
MTIYIISAIVGIIITYFVIFYAVKNAIISAAKPVVKKNDSLDVVAFLVVSIIIAIVIMVFANTSN